MSQQRRATKKKDSDQPSVEARIGRSLPESIEAEAAVLGSMVLDRNCIGHIVQVLKADSFYRLEHQLIFGSILDLYERGPEVDIDLVLLRDELRKKGHLEDVGGSDYLVKIAESVPSAANYEYYSAIVKDKQLLRELISATSEIITEAYSETGDVSEKLDLAEQKIFQVTEKKISGAAAPMSEILHEAFEDIQTREGNDLTGIATGYYELDEMTSGMHKGEMIIIAARPSMGKTSLAMNIAEHVGADEGNAVLIYSLEMGRAQLAERMLCSRSHVDSQVVRKGVMDPNQLQTLLATGSELSRAPIFIDDSPGMTPLDIRAKARRLKAQHDIQLIVIDYLQLITMGGRIESRQQEVSQMSRYLKSLARELEVPIIVLSQLNRGAANREDHRPRMSDIRESGSIEQDADVIMLLHREDYYHRGDPDYEPTHESEIIIAKQRNGPTGTVKLQFQGEYTRFVNISYADEQF